MFITKSFKALARYFVLLSLLAGGASAQAAALDVGTGATVNLSADYTLDTSFTIGANGILNLNGFNLDASAGAVTLSNDGIINLYSRYSETFTNVTMDFDSGTFVYLGNENGNGDDLFIHDFGATDFYNLTINLTDTNENIVLLDPLVVVNNFTLDAGNFATNSQDFTTANLNINGGGFNVGFFSGAMDVNGDVTLTAGSLGATTAMMTVAGHWNNTGTSFYHNSGTVVFDGPSVSVHNVTTSGFAFNNLTLEVGSVIQLQDALYVENHLLIEGSFNNSTNSLIDIKGNWTNSTGLFNGAGQVHFTGAGTQVITTNTNGGFPLVTASGTGTVSLNSDVVMVQLTQTNGVFESNDFAIDSVLGLTFDSAAILGSSVITGDVTLNATAEFETTAFDPAETVTVNGAVTIDGNLLISVTTDAAPGTYTLIDNDGSDAIAGEFTGLAEGTVIDQGTGKLRISYIGGDGNDVVLYSCNAGEYSDSSGCYTCTAGSYCPDTASIISCAPGTYQDLTGQTSCNNAEIGKFVALSGAAEATLCPPGTYQDLAGQTSCKAAEIGKFVNIAGATSSTACSPGYYQDQAGQISCLIAPTGSYVDLTGAASPTLCPAGQYQSLIGQISAAACIDSPAGSYVANEGSASAISCALGTYQDLPGQTSCKVAELGKFVSTTGAISQTACSPGRYQDQTGQISCLIAPTGSYVALSGAVAPTMCSVGEYQSLTGQTSCLQADAGYFVDVTAASAQTACPLGTYQALSGQADCTIASAGYFVDTTTAIAQTACGIGFYQPLTGQTMCIAALNGYYVDVTAASSATQCPAGTTSPAGSTSASDCFSAPILSLADSSIDFGNVTIGNMPEHNLVLSNIGGETLNVSNIEISGANASSFALGIGDTGNGGCDSLAPVITSNSDCYVVVTFNPATEGSFSADLTITSDDLTSPEVVTLTATATVEQLAIISASSTAINFTQSGTQTVTITNNGNINLVIGDIAQLETLEAPYSISADNCSGNAITSGGNCTVDITFAPELLALLAPFGSGLLLIGVVSAFGQRQSTKVKTIYIVTAALLFIYSCSSDNSPDTTIYQDSFDIPSNDSKTPSLIITLDGES